MVTASPEETRDDRARASLTLWRDSPYPIDPSYFLDLLGAVDTRRIDPQQPPCQLQNNRSGGKPNLKADSFDAGSESEADVRRYACERVLMPLCDIRSAPVRGMTRLPRVASCAYYARKPSVGTTRWTLGPGCGARVGAIRTGFPREALECIYVDEPTAEIAPVRAVRETIFADRRRTRQSGKSSWSKTTRGFQRSTLQSLFSQRPPLTSR
jgi:hypothetical protein